VQTISRARETALLGHRDEHCELPELHPPSLSLSAITVSNLFALNMITTARKLMA
jgi:hypothetical protein